ncbi:MAG: WecB/TagA/CpsF family glycosyltransferase [Acidobacteriota bacterium]
MAINRPPKPVINEAYKRELYLQFSRIGILRLRVKRLMRGFTWFFIIQLLSTSKRVVDFNIALLLTILLSPLLIISVLLLKPTGHVLLKTRKLGRWCAPFDEFAFRVPGHLIGRLIRKTGISKLPVLFNIWQGDMSFVGPRAALPGELSPRDKLVRRRYNVRPGLICLWWIRNRANIDYGNEALSDSEYIDNQSLMGDLAIALRAIPAILYGKGVVTAPDQLKILGAKIVNLTMQETVDTILEKLRGHTSNQICFINADCANLAYDDREYLGILNQAELTLADGIGMKLAGKILHQEIKQNVNGTDLFPRLCAALESTDKKIYLLGAKPGIANLVKEWIHSNYPQTMISGCRDGFFSADENEAVVQAIADSGADILLVALGAPKQDKWIHQNLAKTGVKIAMGVGGLFDFYSGRIPRAPQWMREMGLEWFYRFYQEPKRMWRRYFVGNFVFLFRVLKEKFLTKGKSI